MDNLQEMISEKGLYYILYIQYAIIDEMFYIHSYLYQYNHVGNVIYFTKTLYKLITFFTLKPILIYRNM